MMMNSAEGIGGDIKVNNTCMEVVDQFKYCGRIVSDEDSKLEVLSRIAQAIQARMRLKQSGKTKHVYKDEDKAEVDVNLLNLPLCVRHGPCW